MSFSYITITATNGIRNAAGDVIASGALTVFPVDTNNRAVPFTDANGALVLGSSLTRIITNGQLTTPLLLANPALTNPSGIGYTFLFQDTTTNQVVQYNKVVITPNGSGAFDLSLIAEATSDTLPVTLQVGTINVGSTSTLPAGSQATVTNVGSNQTAILNFGIPQGSQGLQGLQGIQGPIGVTGATGATGAQGPKGNDGVSPNLTAPGPIGSTTPSTAAFTTLSVGAINTGNDYAISEVSAPSNGQILSLANKYNDTFVRIGGTNGLVSAYNANDQLGAVFAETFGVAYFGYEHNGQPSVAFAIDASGFFGRVGSVGNQQGGPQGLGAPNWRNIVDDGHGNASVTGQFTTYGGQLNVRGTDTSGSNAEFHLVGMQSGNQYPAIIRSSYTGGLSFIPYDGFPFNFSANGLSTGNTGTEFVVDGNGNLSAASTSLNSSPVLNPSAPSEQIPDIVALKVNRSYYGYGKSLGNDDGWTVNKGMEMTVNNTVRGIKQFLSGSIDNYGIGDTAGVYVYVNTTAPGIQAPSDEGATGLTIELLEKASNFHATINTTSGIGDVSPTFTSVGGDATPCDGGQLVNTSKGTVSGTFNAVSTGFSENWLVHMPITVTTGAVNGVLPLDTAWGFCSSALAPSHLPTTNYISTTQTVTLRPINGVISPFVTGMARLLGSEWPEMVNITAVGSVSNGTQSVTFNYRYPNSGGFYLFQGALVGQTMSFDANQTFHGRRTTYCVGGSVDGTNIIFAVYATGSAKYNYPVPLPGVEAASTIAGMNGVHFYPSAEITAILTPKDTNPPLILLESNNIPFVPGDVIESCPPFCWGGNTAWIFHRVYTPCTQDYNNTTLNLDFGGQGVGGNYSVLHMGGDNPDSFYRIGGGPLDKPVGIDIGSSHDTNPLRNVIRLNHAPDAFSIDNQAALIQVRNTSPTSPGPWRFLSAPNQCNIDVGVDTVSGHDALLFAYTYTYSATMGQLHVVGGLQVDGDFNIQTRSVYDAPSTKAANTQFVFDFESSRGGFTGDIPLNGATLHVTNGRITGYN